MVKNIYRASKPASSTSNPQINEYFEAGSAKARMQSPEVLALKDVAADWFGSPTPAQGFPEEFLCEADHRPLEIKRTTYPLEDDASSEYQMAYRRAGDEHARDLPITPRNIDMTCRRISGTNVARAIPLVPMSAEEIVRSHENNQLSVPRQWCGTNDGEEGQTSKRAIQTLKQQEQMFRQSEHLRAYDGVAKSLKRPEDYAKPFCNFLTENPTVWHAVAYFEKKLKHAGFEKLSEREGWDDGSLKPGNKYYVTRNDSSLIAFTVGLGYESGNGVAMVGGHIDALTARLKPVSTKPTTAGYIQLGVAPYAGALNSTWWDRDLGIGGRVLIRDSETGKIKTKLVKLDWPIARIPTLAPHFGIGMTGQENKETQTVPIIGLDDSDSGSIDEFANLTLGPPGSFAATQPPKLVRAIAGELSVTDYSSIINWELELYDTQPAQLGGLSKEFIFGGRIDDKVCSWAAVEGLLASESTTADGIIKLAAVFDDEEIGSLLRQGARSNFLPSTIERITSGLDATLRTSRKQTFTHSSPANLVAQTYANSFLISADVTHAVNPNFLSSYLPSHAPRLNTGLCICADSNGHMTTDAVSTAILSRIAEKNDDKLQLFMIRNDSRSGGTIGPALSSAMGVRSIDAGIPQLSMHSIRATIGNLDPGLGVKAFKGFFDEFEKVDKEFA